VRRRLARTPLCPSLEENPVKLGDHVRLMASYNEWMNSKLYETSPTLHRSITDLLALIQNEAGA
jgi:hypothetical protein